MSPIEIWGSYFLGFLKVTSSDYVNNNKTTVFSELHEYKQYWKKYHSEEYMV